MNASLRTQAALMLQAPWQWNRNDSLLWVFWLYAVGLALLVGVPTLALTFKMAQGWTAVLMGVLGAVGLVVLWAVQFSALLRLDHPHSARFVASHGRALRAAAMGLWLAMVVFAGVVSMAALRPPGMEPARLLLLVMLAAGATLLYVAIALRWWLLWLVIWLPFPFFGLPWVRTTLKAPLATLRDVWQAHPLLTTALAMLTMAATLARLFGKADAAHARAYARRETFREIAAAGAAGQKPTLAAYGRWGELLGSPFRRLADAWLAHVTRSASHTAGSVMTRAEVVLFGTQHWVRHVAGMMMVQGALLIGWYLLMHSVGIDAQGAKGSSHLGTSIGLASMVIAPLVSLPGSMWGSRREQALLMLLPGMPQGAALNRAVALQQMRHFLLVCAAGLPAFAAMAWWGDAPQVWAFFFTVWPLSAMLWRDASRLRAPSPWAAFLPYLLLVGLGLLSLLLLRWQPALLLPWVLGMVSLTAAVLAWRWRKLSQWPQALPAGRLA